MAGKQRQFGPGVARVFALCVAACLTVLAVAVFGIAPPDPAGPELVDEAVVSTSDAPGAPDASAPEGDVPSAFGSSEGLGLAGRESVESASSSASDKLDGAGAEYRAHEALVRLAEGTSVSDLADALEACDFVSTKSVSPDDVALGWASLDLVPDIDVNTAVNRLMSLGAVADAQPNYVYRALGDVSGDSAATVESRDGGSVGSAQARLAVGAQGSGQQWHLQAIGATEAWSILDPQRDVSVAIIDSGYDTSNSTLAKRVLPGSAYNVLKGDSNANDTYGHGTAVADVVASVLPQTATDSKGQTRNLKIVPVKVMNGGSTDTANLVKAYDYILKKAGTYNIRVINMSLGAVQSVAYVEDAATLYAIDRAFDRGILSVFAGGNDEGTAPYYCFPCDYAENGLGVINLKRLDESRDPTVDNLVRDNSSNYNKRYEKTKALSAPGTSIYAAKLGGKRDTVTGTSFSSPIVAGVAALAFAQNPKLSAGEAKSVLCTSADDLEYTAAYPWAHDGFDAVTGYGLVRADKAVEDALDFYIAGTDSLSVGQSVTLSVPKGGSWRWYSSASDIAAVDRDSGQVRGVSAGEATISATNGTETAQRTIVVYKTGAPSASTVKVGSSAYLGAQSTPLAAWSYSPSDPTIASVGKTTGVVTGKRVGTVRITAQHSVLSDVRVSYVVTVKKGTNPIKVKAKTVKVKASKLRRKAQKVKASKAFKVRKAQGAVTYKLVKRDSKAGKKIKVSKRGKVTIEKGLKRGTYKVKVKVTAAGNVDYMARSKKVALKIKVS